MFSVLTLLLSPSVNPPFSESLLPPVVLGQGILLHCCPFAKRLWYHTMPSQLNKMSGLKTITTKLWTLSARLFLKTFDCVIWHLTFDPHWVGEVYLVPVSGFFCKLCHKFLTSDKAGRAHCKGKLHFKALKVSQVGFKPEADFTKKQDWS